MHYEDVYIQITNERGEKAHKELFPLFTIHMRKGNTIVDFPRSYCAKSMYSMGSGQNGALGIGSEEASQTLRRVVPLANIYSFCVGGDHAHASTSDGFYSWGSGRYSQIGDNGCTMRLTPTRIDSISHERMAHIAGSFSHTLALTTSGKVYVWGSSAGSTPALGLGPDVNTTDVPTLIESLSNKSIRRVFCGKSSCFSFALTAHGDMYAFGRNTSAQLGFGDHRDRAAPEKSEKITRVAVMATALATVIVVNTEGLMFVWGGNSRGLFGKNTSDILQPIEITAARGKDIIQVDCTNDSVFAVSRSGDVLIWEKNNELKTIFKNLRVRSVSCGRYHVLAETHEGEFYGHATYLTHQLLPNAPNNGVLTKLKVDGAFKFIAGDSFTFVLSDTDRDDDRISTAVVTNNAVQPTQQGATRRGFLSWFKRR